MRSEADHDRKTQVNESHLLYHTEQVQPILRDSEASIYIYRPFPVMIILRRLSVVNKVVLFLFCMWVTVITSVIKRLQDTKQSYI